MRELSVSFQHFSKISIYILLWSTSHLVLTAREKNMARSNSIVLPSASIHEREGPVTPA